MNWATNKAAQLNAHLVAQVGVKIGQRFVEEKHAGLAHDGPAHGDALALTAGKLAGHAFEQAVQSEQFGRFLRTPLPLVGGNAAYLQAVGDVVKHVHVRIERVVLEHHGDVAVLRLFPGDVFVADVDVAGGHFLQPCDTAQSRGLAAARRADHDHERAVRHFKVESGEDLVPVERLVYVVQANFCHCLSLCEDGYFSVSTRPRTNSFCMPSTTSSGGSMPSRATAMIRFHSGTASGMFTMR